MDMKLDGYVKAGLHKFWLNDANWIRLVIVDTAAGIGMRIVNGPTVHSFKEGNGEPERAGCRPSLSSLNPTSAFIPGR